jgi:hypothetical protein
MFLYLLRLLAAATSPQIFGIEIDIFLLDVFFLFRGTTTVYFTSNAQPLFYTRVGRVAQCVSAATKDGEEPLFLLLLCWQRRLWRKPLMGMRVYIDQLLLPARLLVLPMVTTT